MVVSTAPVSGARERLRGLRRLNWPYPVVYAKRRLQARRPRTFSEKLKYKMVHDRRALLSVFADKVAVRDYVAATIGAEHLTELLAVADDPRSIDWAALPREYVCKASHGCGGSVIVTEDAPPGPLPDGGDPPWEIFVVRPDDVSVEAVVRMSRSWLGRRYGWGPGTAWEWVYRDVRPRVLVEELLRDADGKLPRDLRFYVFNGRCRLVQVDSSWVLGGTRRDFFDPEWQQLPISSVYPRSEVPPPRPRQLARMVELAERLAQPTDFVRVDLYDLGDRVVFGELTSTPVGGNPVFDPPSFDAELGQWWAVPPVYSEPAEPLAGLGTTDRRREHGGRAGR